MALQCINPVQALSSALSENNDSAFRVPSKHNHQYQFTIISYTHSQLLKAATKKIRQKGIACRESKKKAKHRGVNW